MIQDGHMSDEDALELLEELQLNRSDAIREQRADGSVQHVAACAVHAGSLSQRSPQAIPGRTLTIAPGTVTLVLRTPLHVGDLYHVTFDQEKLDATPRYARCVGCREVNDRFEIELALFEALDLKTAIVG